MYSARTSLKLLSFGCALENWPVLRNVGQVVVRATLQSRLSNNNDIFCEVGHPVVMTIYEYRESNLFERVTVIPTHNTI